MIVALNRSHIENGFTKTSQSSAYALPLRLLTVAVDTTVTTHCDNQPRGRSDSERVLVIGEEDFRSGDPDSPEDSSTYAAEERKLDNIV